MSWAYEKIACYVADRRRKHHTPLYRAWNGEHHFYTTSKDEYEGLPDSYDREGIIAYMSRRKLSGHVKLYRAYRDLHGDNMLTTLSDADDRKLVKKYGNVDVLGYVAAKQDRKHVPLMRAWDPERRDHFCTADVGKIDEFGPTLTDEELVDVLGDRLVKYLEDCEIYTADGAYYCPTRKVAKEIVQNARIDQNEYIEERFDCDDFAHLLKGAFIEDVYVGGRRSMPWAMGIVWGFRPPHAMNVIVLSNGREDDWDVRIVEPQNGIFYRPESKKLRGIYLILC